MCVQSATYCVENVQRAGVTKRTTATDDVLLSLSTYTTSIIVRCE